MLDIKRIRENFDEVVEGLNRRGAAVSAFASCFFFGQAVGVSLAGLLVGVVGTTALLGLGALGVLAVTLACATQLARRDRARPA